MSARGGQRTGGTMFVVLSRFSSVGLISGSPVLAQLGRRRLNKTFIFPNAAQLDYWLQFIGSDKPNPSFKNG